MGLRSLLSDLRTARDLLSRQEACERAVRDLADVQVSREAAFTKLRDDVLRYFKRIQELDRRGINASSDDDAPRAAAIERVLQMKALRGGK
jgi:hypothetical protein